MTTNGSAAAPIAPPGSASCPAGMQYVPAGKLFLGDDEASALERPAHQVQLSAFCVDTTEVTVDAYRQCSDKGDCKRAGTTNEWDGLSAQEAKTIDPFCNARDPDKRRAHPVNCVTWDMANRFCQVHMKRLPTEAEWEYAARGSDGRRFPWGDDAPNQTLLNACGQECAELGKQAHLPLEALYPADDGWPTTAPVGSFPRGKSRFGVEDLAGNVWEWTADWYAPYAADAQFDPKGPTSGRYKVVRGGAWNVSGVASLRPTARHRDAPDKRSFTIGLRCAASPGAP
jgi:formylglycine-generating enzyme required for sulfatase activity